MSTTNGCEPRGRETRSRLLRATEYAPLARHRRRLFVQLSDYLCSGHLSCKAPQPGEERRSRPAHLSRTPRRTGRVRQVRCGQIVWFGAHNQHRRAETRRATSIQTTCAHIIDRSDVILIESAGFYIPICPTGDSAVRVFNIYPVTELTLFRGPSQYLITRHFSFWSVPGQSNSVSYLNTGEIGRGMPGSTRGPVWPIRTGGSVARTILKSSCIPGFSAYTILVDCPYAVGVHRAFRNVGVRIRGCVATGVVHIHFHQGSAPVRIRFPHTDIGKRPAFFSQDLVAGYRPFRGGPTQLNSFFFSLAPPGRQSSW